MSDPLHTTDLEALAMVLRRNVTRQCGTADDDSLVTLRQIAEFAEQTLRRDVDGFLVDQSAIDQIVQFIRLALVSGTLCDMAANNEVHCAWDDDACTMVFWKPSEEVDKPDSSGDIPL